MKGSTVALVAVGVLAVGGIGWFVYSANKRAIAAAQAAAKASAGSQSGSSGGKSAGQVAGDIIKLAPQAIELGQQIAAAFK